MKLAVYQLNEQDTTIPTYSCIALEWIMFYANKSCAIPAKYAMTMQLFKYSMVILFIQFILYLGYRTAKKFQKVRKYKTQGQFLVKTQRFASKLNASKFYHGEKIVELSLKILIFYRKSRILVSKLKLYEVGTLEHILVPIDVKTSHCELDRTSLRKLCGLNLWIKSLD